MQTPQAINNKYRTAGMVLCLLICSLLMVCSPPVCAGSRTSAAAVQTLSAEQLTRRVVSFIEQGQWEAAGSLLDRQDTTADPVIQSLQRILDEHQSLAQTRTEKQQQIFTERYQKLSAAFERVTENDPNLNFQNVFRQMQNVWKDADENQKIEIAAQPPFRSLMARARQNAKDCYEKGQWSKAYTSGVWWLMRFEPDSPDSRKWDKKLGEVGAIMEFLKENSCEDKKERYTPIQRQTVRRIFSILQTHYVRPPNHNKMAAGMLNRAVILGDVLKTAPDDLIFQVDPNDVTRWAAHLEQLSADSAQKQPVVLNAQELEDFLDAMLALNKQTLKLPEGFMLAMMTDAALAELDDYTNMVWPYAVREFDKEMTGQFGGVGIHIRKERNGLRVMSLIPDTPAMKAGLQADALITAVNGESIRDLSAACAVQKISGPVGTPVTLTIRYPGAETEEQLTIIRGNIVIPAVEGSRQANVKETDTINDETVTDEESDLNTIRSDGHWDYFLDEDARIGYLRLKNFTEQTVPEVENALQKLESSGLAALVLDLRGNGGGLLTSAIQISDMFVDEGILLHSQGRAGRFAIWPATANESKRSYPLAVLIDGASASASEIVAGILNAPVIDRAVVVGQRSYGKGSVQEVVELESGKGKLKFTTACYYLPDGSPVKNRDSVTAAGRDDWGIAPDISVPLYDFERRQMRRINTKRTTVTNAETDAQTETEESIRRDMLSADPQLATALLVLKAKIALGQ